MVDIRWKDKSLWDIWWDFTLAETVFLSIFSMITNLKSANLFSVIIAVIVHGCR